MTEPTTGERSARGGGQGWDGNGEREAEAEGSGGSYVSQYFLRQTRFSGFVRLLKRLAQNASFFSCFVFLH